MSRSSETTGMAGTQPRQALGDDVVGGVIGLRHRRSVLLAVDFHGQ